MDKAHRYKNIKVIGFDADDTLWVNETYFRETEHAFAQLLSRFETPNNIEQELFKMEMQNLKTYGYGIKGFVLSMVESALQVSNYKVTPQEIERILQFGKNMIEHPVELLEGVYETLKALEHLYKLILITKGDLLDQERKLAKSGLTHFFHHIEILSEKNEENYSNLLNQLSIKPSEFLMIGNSLKSDVLPLINIKSNAVHVPFHTTWIHEYVSEEDTNGAEYLTINKLNELINHLVIP
ncbi:MAG: HAD family hydrolase [Flavobacteriaceae bacterium]|nr:HAD family hydrolase [Flavobacteriaceae bacterium]MDZ4146736.1 HAD family hydrolase [Flavobacteriaceae bacterium]